MKENKRILLKNTLMLYVLTVSGYVFSFITVPYQTRVLGLEGYGALGFAQACSVYIQLLLDFGFILSATEDVANHAGEPKELSKILSAVLLCKTGLAVAAFGVVLLLCTLVPRFGEDRLLYVLYFLSTFFSALLPDFLYRGLERMSAITVRTVAVKLFFTVMIFLVLRRPEQYYAVPILNGLGALGACIWTYWDVYRRLGIRPVAVSPQYVLRTFRRSAGFFVSRIASTVYGATNTVIVGFLYPAGAVLGYYTSAEKLITTAKGAVAPIADSLYPYMVKNRDFRLIRRVLLVLMPLIILGCAVVGIFAEPFCALLLGEEFRPAGRLLRLLLPVAALALPVYLAGFPLLSPLGLARYANRSALAGAGFHAGALLMLYAWGNLTVQTICLSTCITEALILCIRLWAAGKGRTS